MAADSRSTQPVTSNAGTGSAAVSNGRSTIATTAFPLVAFVAHDRYDFTHGADDRVWSFNRNTVSTVGNQHLTSATRTLRKSTLEVHPSSSYARFD
jgi:hypothetical protein